MSPTHFLAPMVLLFVAIPCAASKVDLHLKGLIVPSACQIGFANNGVLDFGLIKASSLRFDTSNPLTPRNILLNIDCLQPTKVSLKIRDDRSNSMVAGLMGARTGDEQAFGLGLAGTARIGSYAMRLPRASFTVDNRQAELLASADGGRSWQRTGPAGDLRWDRTFAWTWPETRQPVQVSTVRAVVIVVPYIAQASTLPLGRDITLDGQATFELQYI